jgi:hypothetical protein
MLRLLRRNETREFISDSRVERQYATEGILQPVSEHPWAQALSPAGQESQKAAVDHDDEHCSAVEAVTEAEDYSLEQDCDFEAASPCAELLHEVSAEDELFAETTRCCSEY